MRFISQKAVEQDIVHRLDAAHPFFAEHTNYTCGEKAYPHTHNAFCIVLVLDG